MRSLGQLCVVLFVSLCAFAPATLAYNGGAGTSVSPYQIYWPADWQTLMATSGDWAKYFVLTADIDLQGIAATPVGSSSTHFTGSLNGNGHVIRNVTINMPTSTYVGLFGYLAGSGQIWNLGLENVSVTGQWHTGGLVGIMDGGSLTSCHATGSVSGQGFIGGVVGLKASGSVTSCYATASVSGTSSNIGGLAGYNTSGPVTLCFATGSVTSTSGWVGGLVGVNYDGTLTACCATGSASGTQTIGGLVGENTGSLTDCYATGPTTGSQSNVGGLAGRNNGSVTRCYAAGVVTGPILNDTAGFIGWYQGGTLTSCFWDTSASGWAWGVGGGSVVDGLTGKTSAEMRTKSTFASAGWDFTDNWGIIDRQTYPYLKELPLSNPADLNCSGTVDFLDFALFAEKWLQ